MAPVSYQHCSTTDECCIMENIYFIVLYVGAAVEPFAARLVVAFLDPANKLVLMRYKELRWNQMLSLSHLLPVHSSACTLLLCDDLVPLLVMILLLYAR